MTINELDPSQKSALRSIVEDRQDRNLFLVYGPPGTGKSQLLVSLLFELAINNKRVLFVSQNIEALAVIERMIARVEKEMHFSEDHLSLSDFCLKLYAKEHRYLKYIRGQSSRINAKGVPSIDSYEDHVETNHSYTLSYTKLDRAANYSVQSAEIGIDELLTSFMQYVDMDLAVETLENFEDIDLRQVLRLFDEYKNFDDFTYYNQPQNELRLISTSNPSVNLTEIQNGVREIGALGSKIVNTPVAKVATDIQEYISLLEKYSHIQQYLDLYRLQVDNTDLQELGAGLKAASSESKQLLAKDEVMDGLELVKRSIFLDESQVKFLDVEVIDNYSTHLQELLKIIETFRRVDKDLLMLESKDLLLSLLKKLDIDLSPVTARIPDFSNCNAQEIDKILAQTLEYSQKGKIEHLLKSLPESYKEYLPNAKKGDQDLVWEYYPQLKKIAEVLRNTNVKLKTYEQLFNKSQQYKQAMDLFASLEIEKVPALTNKILRAVELTRMYGLEKSSTINDLRIHTEALLSDLDIYTTILRANKSKAIRMTSSELVHSINSTVNSHLSKGKIDELFDKYGRYLSNASSTDHFLEVVEESLKCLQESGEDIEAIRIKLDLPTEFLLTDSDSSLASLNNILTTLKDKALYSNRFFIILEGQDLAHWYEMVRNVQHFHNLDELDLYIQHHKFITDLNAALARNSAWLQTILDQPSISFYDFASRVVNSVVRTCFQNLPSTRRKIITNDLLRSYSEKLKIDRSRYYLEGLKTLSRQTAQTARDVSNPNNWQAGNSTMEKIRNSTGLLKNAFPIVIATPKEVAKYISPAKESFDYVIFDEASQLLPGQALPSIFRAKKAVVVGDPHQMPPSLTAAIGGHNKEDEEEFDTADSILDLVKNMQPETQYHLKVHYRSEANKLFEPSREIIYAQDGIQPIYEAQMQNAAPIDIRDNLGTDLDQTGKFDKNFGSIITQVDNYLEADTTASFCILFLRAEDMHAFKDYLATFEGTLGRIYKLYSENKILISTVTNCQGIEGTYSIIYFRHYDSPGAMWFFRETAGAYKRLNVAITRQTRGLTILMADPKERWLEVCENKLENPETPPSTRKSAELLRSLLNNAGEITDTEYLDKRLGENSLRFDSPLIEQLYKKLNAYYKPHLNTDLKIYCGIGWYMLIPDEENPEENKRNVGFKVDLGVYSMQQKKFILGIETDGTVYHTDFDKEHSDYQRHKVLKTKLWDMHRIWSTNWLNNQSTEFERLTRKINSILGLDNSSVSN